MQQSAHENHEHSSKVSTTRPAADKRRLRTVLRQLLGYNKKSGPEVLGPPIHHLERSLIMAWQTPAACDLRFGFEITMYIANR
jgi:coenzyme PQQ precursor peptide PqqA